DLDLRALGTIGAHHPLAAQALGLLKRGLDIGHLNIEGDVAVVALHAAADAAADSGAFGIDIALARDHPVLHRVVGVDLPSEQLPVIRLKLLGVLTYHLEM